MSSSLFDGYKLNEKEVLNRLDHWSKQLDEELNRHLTSSANQRAKQRTPYEC